MRYVAVILADVPLTYRMYYVQVCSGGDGAEDGDGDVEMKVWRYGDEDVEMEI